MKRILFFVFVLLLFANCAVNKDQTKANSSDKVSFTIRNNTTESIPLIIPNVMNPNLSPNSDSKVTLNLGQQIYFKNGLKRYVLLEVNNDIGNNDIIDVAQLIITCKKELDL